LCIVLTFAAVLAGPPARADETPRRILILHAFNYTLPATTVMADAARSRIIERSAQKIEFYGDFLDLFNMPDPGHALRTAEFLHEKYAHRLPDVIVTLGSEALPFIVKNRDVIAPGVPVVFAGVSRENYSSARPPSDMTGAFVTLDLERTLALAEALQPDAR